MKLRWGRDETRPEQDDDPSDPDLSRKGLLKRIVQLEATVAELQANAREADGIVALLVGLLAESTGTQLEIDPEDAPQTAREEWLGHIAERYLFGQNAKEVAPKEAQLT